MNPEPGDPPVALRGPLEHHRATLADFVSAAQGLDPAYLNTPRAPGKWTPLQEVAHLAQVCSEFAAVLSGGPEFALLVPPERAARYRDSVLPRILAEDWFPAGASAPSRTEPAELPGSLAELQSRLRAGERDLEWAIVAACRADPERRVVHPYFGPMTLPDLLTLLARHARHHAELLRTPRSPA